MATFPSYPPQPSWSGTWAISPPGPGHYNHVHLSPLSPAPPTTSIDHTAANRELIEALGLDPNKVMRLDITMRPGAYPTVEVVMLVPEVSNIGSALQKFSLVPIDEQANEARAGLCSLLDDHEHECALDLDDYDFGNEDNDD